MNTIEVIKNWIDKESEVLDLGCGDGEIMNILSREWGSTVLGVEIFSVVHEKSQEKIYVSLEDLEDA